MYVTIWTKGKTNPRRVIYRTQSLTPVHARLRATANGITHHNPSEVFTQLVPGMPLDEPIVVGGTRIQ